MPAEPASSQPAVSADSRSGCAGDYVRLHITPLDAELLKIVIPASVLPSARNISYHTIQTFPEKRYGFVELPQMDAEKLKKKLNGSVLKGSKVRIDKARPEKRIESTGDADRPEKKRKKSKDGSEGLKRQKRDPRVLEGVTLQGRIVKRGWTESVETKTKNKKNKAPKDGKGKEKHKRAKSKYTDKEECLLKVQLPPNAMGNLTEEDVYKKRKKKGKSREVTVHEFEKTTKFPSFLKSSEPDTSGKMVTEFVEGKGWVDEEGNVVEAVKTRVANALPQHSATAKSKAASDGEPDNSTSSSGTSSSEEEEEEEEEDARDEAKGSSKLGNQSESEIAANDPEEDEPPEVGGHATPLPAAKVDASKSISSTSLKLKMPGPTTTTSENTVHPLEALYKRPKPDANATEAPAQPEPFSFFGGAGSEEDEQQAGRAATTVPMTPFTRHDSERRKVRSAAPTPDTTHPSRIQSFTALKGDDDVDEDDEDEDEGNAAEADEPRETPAQGQRDRSDFQTWFWENRSELNRSWMSRRKMAAKEKRYRENKARASKTV